MPVLPNYHQFDGLHWDTGPIRNALDYQGVIAPHTGQPLTEALLFGISGGIVAGYFTFEYTGLDPWLHFLTRISFDPMQTLIERLGIPTRIKQTDKADKASQNLLDTLAEGKPALVWADYFSLPYNHTQPGKDQYMMFPLLVYGYADDTVRLADRARVPLTLAAGELAAARARINQAKHRLMTLDAPDLSQLPPAVEAGIRACIAHMTGPAPRKPMQGKYGLDAFQRWAALLVDPKKEGWAKAFPGVKLYAVLKTGFTYINLWGTGGNGARSLYADFLGEAAGVLGKPALKTTAGYYRVLAERWGDLNRALLPDHLPPFKETRELLQRDYDLFMTHGGKSLPERQMIAMRLGNIRTEAERNPLTETESAALRENLRAHVLKVHDAEKEAIFALKTVIDLSSG